MEQWSVLWTDEFFGPSLGSAWVGGHVNLSREGSIRISGGVVIEFAKGNEYSSCGIVTRLALTGDFDARVRFSVQIPSQGSTLELAAISIDPPRESGLDQDLANQYSRSRVYDVHGAPPYVSSEFDENDGWRITWNRGSAQTVVGKDGGPISDNHYNRYGRSIDGPAPGPAEGWLRLVRRGSDWTSYRLDDDNETWRQTGEARCMNLPQAVYLRLAAKHWVKNGLPAPANQISFRRFELRVPATVSQQDEDVRLVARSDEGAESAQREMSPTEVRLVQEVHACRDCDFFGSASPYGPFLKVRQNDEPVEENQGGETAVRMAVVTGFGQPEPSVLHGCRKAPIMLIGINPNLPGHFILPRDDLRKTTPGWRSGSYRLLPSVQTDAEYAARYRYAPTPNVELADASTLERLLRDDLTVLVAPKTGRIKSDGEPAGSHRAPERRYARLALDFDDGTSSVYNWPTHGKDNWGADENLAIVRGRFEAGEVVAGFLDRSVVGQTVTVRNGREDSYYRNARALLHMVGKGMNSSLVLGEDMSLHDVVACASPGWDPKWKLPQSLIASNCAEKNHWLHQQIKQSNPQVILITSRVALSLFADSSLGKLSTPINELPLQAGGKDGLFYRVAQDGLWWNRDVCGAPVSTRIVLAPHISYSDNLTPHSYFEGPQWDIFQQVHSAAVARLRLQLRPGSDRSIVMPVFGEGDMMVCLESDDPLWNVLKEEFPAAEKLLRTLWLDPVDVIGSAIAEELKRQGLEPTSGGRLPRSAGPCVFCNNSLWIVGGGCAYGVPRT